MGERDWAAEARERWLGCNSTAPDDRTFRVVNGGIWRTALRFGGGWRAYSGGV